VDDDCARARLPFPGSRLPPGFTPRTVAIAPCATVTFEAAAWRDTIVGVEHGEIDLVCAGGARLRCLPGDVLWLTGLSLIALHNPGDEPAVLVAVRRSPPAAVDHT
jgi:hypothetical protein